MAHSSQQILEHGPWFIAHDADHVIVDKARSELVATGTAASDWIAGFQFPFRLWKMIELTFSEDDHRHRCLGAATED